MKMESQYTSRSARSEIRISNDIYTLDTEATTLFKHDGVWMPYCDAVDTKRDPTVAFCYASMICDSQGATIYRDLQDLYDRLAEISASSDDIKVLWVHNLGYDIQWLMNILLFDNVFAKKPHRVIYAEWKKLQFRCSYMLTHQSLDALSNSYHLEVKKATGKYDYNKFRTPLTPLSAAEEDYCIRDVKSLYKGIEIYRDRFGSIAKIPYTQTGAVRNRIKCLYHDDDKHHTSMSKLIPSYTEYALLQMVKWGGYTHASFLYADMTIHDRVDSLDISSSYPYQLVSKKYPMSRFLRCDPELYRCDKIDKYAFIFYIVIDNYDINTYSSYISVSHCVKCIDGVYDNGRVMRAKHLEIYVTDVDYTIIRDTCDQDIKIKYAWCAIKDYLPVSLLLEILDMYGKKTSQKGVDNNLYMRSKEELNSVYGMMLSALVYGNTTMDANTGKWSYRDPSEQDIVDRLSYLRQSKYKNNYSYAWGVWCVAYGRRQIWDAIIRHDDYNIYNDTDSIKLIDGYDADWFGRYNSDLVARLDSLMVSRGIDPELTRPRKADGTPVQLGVFDHDDTYVEFKTLGAKRYCYRDARKNELHMTVAGVNKEHGAECLRGNIDNFKSDMKIAYEHCKRLVLKYDNDQPVGLVLDDGWVLDQRFAVKSIPSTYTMNLESLYLDLIMRHNDLNNDLPDNIHKLHDIIMEEQSAKNKKRVL